MTAKQPSINTKSIERKLARLARRRPKLAERVLDLTVEGIMAEASSQDAMPRKTGFLANSGTVVKKASKRIFGFNATYAAAVHERHAAKPFFLRNAITKDGQRIFRAAGKVALEEEAKKAGLTQQ